MEVLVVDYGAGNLTSVMKALRAVGTSPVSGAGAEAVARAAAIVIPGVGHFRGRRRSTTARATRFAPPSRAVCRCSASVLDCSGCSRAVTKRRRSPVSASFRDAASTWGQTGVRPGSDQGQTGSDLGLTLVEPRSDPGLTPLKVPHVGWNTVEPVGRPSRLLDGILPSSFAYFTHSYAAPVVDDSVATTTHGEAFTAVVERGRVFGVQFHPEKSGDAGLRLLANFVRVAEGAPLTCSRGASSRASTCATARS